MAKSILWKLGLLTLVISARQANSQVTTASLSDKLKFGRCETTVAVPAVFHIHTVPLANSRKNILQFGFDFDHALSTDYETACQLAERYGIQRGEEVAIYFSDHGQKISWGMWCALFDISYNGLERFKAVIPHGGYEYTQGALTSKIIHHLGVYESKRCGSAFLELQITDAVANVHGFPTQRKPKVDFKDIEVIPREYVSKYFIAPKLEDALARMAQTGYLVPRIICFNHPWLSRDSFYNFDFSQFLSKAQIYKLKGEVRLIEIAGGEAGDACRSLDPGLKYYSLCLQKGWFVAPIVGADNFAMNPRLLKARFEKLQTYIWASDDYGYVPPKSRIVPDRWVRYNSLNLGIQEGCISVSSAPDTRVIFTLDILKPDMHIFGWGKNRWTSFSQVMGSSFFWRIGNWCKVGATLAIYNPRKNKLTNLAFIWIAPEFVKVQFAGRKRNFGPYIKSSYLYSFGGKDTYFAKGFSSTRRDNFDIYEIERLDATMPLLGKTIAVYVICEFSEELAVTAPVFLNRGFVY